MSRIKLLTFLEKLDTTLARDNASDDYRRLTANKLHHTVSITPKNLTNILRSAIKRSTNIGDIEYAIKAFESPEYKKILDNFMNTVRSNFTKLAANNSVNVIFKKGSRSGPIKIILLVPERGSRGNFEIAKKQYTEPLQAFYENVLKLLETKSIKRKSTSNKSGEVDQTKAGQLFNLEHFKSTSNVKAFLNDSIHTALTSTYTKDEYANLEQDLKSLGLKTSLQISKNVKTGTIKVHLGSQFRNVQDSAGEQKLKTDLQAILKRGLEKLKGDLVILSGSDSLLTGQKKIVLKVVTDPFRKIKGAKVKTTSTKIIESKRKETLDVSPKVKKGAAVTAGKIRKSRVRKGTKRKATNPLSMLALLNKDIGLTVANNMYNPRLNLQSGRFAESVRITDVTITARGFPSVGYTYDKFPYQTFEPGYAQGDVNRDPRVLIDKSIRELATQFAVGRFYTRRM
jgi:hypothetical protein